MSLPDRYHRQRLLPELGDEGQSTLGAAHAVVLGLGALGSTVADQLARAGVGRLTLIDRDVVELTNLQRQSLYVEADAAVRTPKAIAAAERLGRVNSAIAVEARVSDLSPDDAGTLLGLDHEPPDILLDCTDNFETRYLMNDVSVRHALPLVYAGVVGVSGRTMLVAPGSACLRCVFPDPPAPGTQPTCDSAGVLGPAAAMIASRQAALAIRSLLGDRGADAQLWTLDAWSGRARSIGVARDPQCPCCGRRSFEFLESGGQRVTSLCGVDAVQIRPASAGDIDLGELATRLAPHGEFSANPYVMRGLLEQEQGEDGQTVEVTVFRDGRAIISGTGEESRARALYARYIGA